MKNLLRLKDPKTGKISIIDLNNCGVFTESDYIKCGARGKEAQYKYFCEHPEEIEDRKLFSELEKEFGENKKKF